MRVSRCLATLGGLLAAAPLTLGLGAADAADGAPKAAGPLGPVRMATPILTLDQDRLFSQSRMGRAIEARFAAESQTLIDENRRIEAALEQEERDLTARRPTMAAADFAPLASAFDTKVEGIRKAQDAKAQDLTKRHDSERQAFFKAAAPILAEVMRDAGAVAIIDKQAVFLSFDGIDATAQAIARLDAELGDGAASLPPPAPGAVPADPATPMPAAPAAP